MNMWSSSLVVLCLAAMASLSVAARDIPDAAGCGPFVPPALCPSTAGGLLPNLPSTPSSGGSSSCGPFIPPAVCDLLSPFVPHPSPPSGGSGSACGPFIPPAFCPPLGGGLVPHLPSTPPAAGGSSNCGPFIPPAVCNLFGAHPPPPATPAPPSHN